MKIKWWPRGLWRFVCACTVEYKERRVGTFLEQQNWNWLKPGFFKNCSFIWLNKYKYKSIVNYIWTPILCLIIWSVRQLTSTVPPVVFSWIQFTPFLILVLCLYRPTFLYNNVLICNVWNLVITSYLGYVVKCTASPTCWGIYKTMPMWR